MSPRRAMIDRIVRTQHGVISRAQAVDEAGCTEGYIAARLRSGEWERAAPGIFMVRSVEPTWRTSLMAACLSLGAVASHRSAARVWDIDGFDNDGPEVTIARAGGRGRAGVIVHESTQTEDMEVVIIDNIPCTSAARTILDLGAVIGPRRLEWAIDDVLRRGIVEIPDLEQVLRRHSRRGRKAADR